jgi:hypothetical protein
MNKALRFAVAGALAAYAVLACAGENRTVLIDQSDFANHRGFYLDLENRGPDGQTLGAGSIKLILGVADGKDWHFLFAQGELQEGRAIHVRARIGDGKAALFVDGKDAGEMSAALATLDGPMKIDENPSWASAAADYRIEQGTFRAVCGASTASGTVPVLSAKLAQFGSPMPMEAAFRASSSEPVEIETVFTIAPSLPVGLDGAIDRFGQAVAADWPGKVKTEAEIRASKDEEAVRSKGWRRPASWDTFGGDKSAPWHVKPTGYFATVKRAGVWWLVSPEGHPLFYTGICTSPSTKWDYTPVEGRERIFQELPPADGPTASLWSATGPWDGRPQRNLALQSWNLLRKFGAGWERASGAECKARIEAWGFSGEGKWSNALPGLPYVPVLNLEGVPRLTRHPDPFAPAVREQVKESLQRQIEPMRLDPYVVGYSIGNEFDEIVTKDEIRDILKNRPDSSAAAALSRAGATATSDDAGIEKARRLYAAKYYELLYTTVKELDPNHLYLGFWIVPGWWENDADWDLIAPYCDVIGYDRYAQSYSGIESFEKRCDKPTLLGEYSFPAWYGGGRGFGRYEGSFVETDRDSGLKYAEWIAAASRDPSCVGALWFEYRDEPITGRGPGSGLQLVLGEHYAFGFVDDTDRPKWDLVTLARQANLRATEDRLGLR